MGGEDKERLTGGAMGMGVLLRSLRELTMPGIPDEVAYHTEVSIHPV